MGKETKHPPFTSEQAREYQKRSVEAKKRNREQRKTIAETLEKQLHTVITNPKHLDLIEKSGMPVPKKPTYLDYVIASKIISLTKSKNIADLLVLRELLGEETQTNDAPVSENMQSLAELINNPQKNRNIEEFEGEKK